MTSAVAESAQSMLTASASAQFGLRMKTRDLDLDGLSMRQRLACCFRLLARAGWSETFQGHITCADRNGNFVVNPWGLWWDEVGASDLCVASPDGGLVEGDSDVSPAIFIHTELHRARPDARVIVHNHPYYGTLLASMGAAPTVNTQSSCLFHEEIGVIDDFSGPVDNAGLGQRLAAEIGSASACLLTSHGVLILAPTIEAATFRAISFERACKLTYHMLVAGRPALPIDAAVAARTKERLDTLGVEAYWAGAVRLLLRDEPDVLS
jgi:ribulose-5-phosphate 4-epimerase/fuculose-1-phosphate aldolase